MPGKHAPRVFITVSELEKLDMEQRARENGQNTSAYLRMLFVLGQREFDRRNELAKRVDEREG